MYQALCPSPQQFRRLPSHSDISYSLGLEDSKHLGKPDFVFCGRVLLVALVDLGLVM